MNYLKQALMELLSGLTTKKNEKEIWTTDEYGFPIAIEPIDDENYMVRRYYESNKLHCECCFKNNKANGVYRCWHRTGVLGWECQYKSGQLCGAFKSWNENGILEREEYWENGKRIKVIK